jgi:FtsP/CotA-like multicopper oxidase with cupredoxin domain
MSPGYDSTKPIDPPAYFSCANYAISQLPLRSCTGGTAAGTACYGNLECATIDPVSVCNGPVQPDPATGLPTGIHKFVDPLPNLVLAQGSTCPAGLTGPPADCYTIKLIETTWKFHTDLPPTKVRGYIEVVNGIDQPYSYLGPVIVATKNKPVRITFINALPAGTGGNLFIPMDSTYMGAGPGDQKTGNGDPQRPDCSKSPKPAGCYTDNRATLHLHGGINPWISDGTPHQWITPATESTPYPKGVSVKNVPDMGTSCDAANSGCMTFYYTNQQSARMMFYHDHAWGITRLNVYAGEAAGYLITDPTEQALIGTGGPLEGLGVGSALVIQDKTFVPTDKELQLWDPLWEKSRWGGQGSLWQPHVYEPAQNPGDSSGVNAFGRWMYGPWFWPPTNDITNLPIANPYYDPACQNAGLPWCEPPLMPGTPYVSSGMEAFNDTPVVNGKAYPTLTVDPKQYRFRILNGANDRFFNLQMYVADPAEPTEVKLNAAEVLAAQSDPVIVPTPDTNISPKGPAWIVISTEGGYLPAPVLVPNQVITWVTDPTLFNVGNVDLHSLLLAPAERADVIVDFTPFAGKTLILYNDGPAAFPARVATYDYYLGHPDMTDTGGAPETLPGYGPNTRTVMQIKVNGSGGAGGADYYNPATLTALQNAFKHQLDANSQPAGVFESSQHPIIVGQAAYNSAYGTAFRSTAPKDGFARIYDFSLNFDTLSGTELTMPLANKAIHDEMGGTFDPDYGRMTGTLGVEVPNAKAYLQQFVNFPYTSPPSEIIDTSLLPKGDELHVTPISSATDGSQIWKITHNGVDTHPIHFHLYDVQLLNRVGWDGFIRTPHPTELGWKDTVRISPLEDTFVALRPVTPVVPFELPNSIRLLNPAMPDGALLASATLADAFLTGNIPMDPLGEPIDLYNHVINFGFEYVWHCHILGHEEMDMMRSQVVGVPPKAPTNLAVTSGGNTATLTWADNSANETGFTVVRANDLGFVSGLTTVTLAPDTTTYADKTIKNNTTYYYKVIANNLVGDTWDYTNPAINEGASFPTKDVMSAPSNVAMLGTAPLPPAAPSNLVATAQAGPQVRLTWKDNAKDETGFVLQRSVNGGAFGNLVTLPVNTTSYTDTAVAAPNTYDYRIQAINGGGSSAFSNTSGVTLGALPAAPSNVVAVVSNLKNNSATVTVTWKDNATTETGFTIKRATDVAFTQNLSTATVGMNVQTYSQSVNRNQTLYYCVQSTNANGASPCVLAVPSPTIVQ